MTAPSPARPYDSTSRRRGATQTRRRVLEAATALFSERAYAGTTVRAIADRAGVSVPTVEALFGRKREVLKVAIDVARAGDDEPVGVIERLDADPAAARPEAEALIEAVAARLAAAQERSAALVLTVFEGAATDPDLAELAKDLAAQRAGTAAWLVDQLHDRAPRPRGVTRQDAIDTVWLLMEPALHDRMRRHRGWDERRYRRWIADALTRLLTDPAKETSS